MFSPLTNTFRRVAAPPRPTRPPFVVHVLGHAVEVVITARELVNHDGCRTRSAVEGDERRILIAATTPLVMRLEAVLYSAWEYARFNVQLPTTHDGVCQLFALVAEPVFMDLAAQGGVEALMSLQPADAREDGAA